MTSTEAAQAAALLLGRVDAGILTDTETAPVAATVETVLGADTLAELRVLWWAALQLDDQDTAGVIELGRRWCETLGQDPHTQPGTHRTAAHDADTDAGSEAGTGGGAPAGPGARSPLAESITEALGIVEAAVAAEAVPADPATLAAEQRAQEQAAREGAAHAARRVFTSGGRRTGRTAIAGTRTPNAVERAAARQLARAIDTAGVRDRVATKTTSATPPGRLRMRDALAADA